MSDIEKDIKNTKELIIGAKLYKQYEGNKYYKSMENILQDYTRQKQINEEHQKINGELRERVKELEEENKKYTVRFEERDDELWERVKQCKNMQTEIDRLYTDKEELQQAYLHEKLAKEEVEELLEESIPKQKIKDKIEELRDDIKNDNCRYPPILEHKIDILKEIIN